MAAAMMSCRQLAVDNSSSAKSRSACLVSMSLRNADANARSGAIASRAGHGSSQSELRASPGRKSLLMHGFDDIRVVSDLYKAVPLMLFAQRRGLLLLPVALESQANLPVGCSTRQHWTARRLGTTESPLNAGSHCCPAGRMFTV